MALLEGLIVTAQQRGELRSDVDPAQLAFELYAPLELANYLSTLHRDPGIVDRGRAAVRTAIGEASSIGATGPTRPVRGLPTRRRRR
jgi:hypothetical protein